MFRFHSILSLSFLLPCNYRSLINKATEKENYFTNNSIFIFASFDDTEALYKRNWISAAICHCVNRKSSKMNRQRQAKVQSEEMFRVKTKQKKCLRCECRQICAERSKYSMCGFDEKMWRRWNKMWNCFCDWMQFIVSTADSLIVPLLGYFQLIRSTDECIVCISHFLIIFISYSCRWAHTFESHFS